MQRYLPVIFAAGVIKIRATLSTVAPVRNFAALVLKYTSKIACQAIGTPTLSLNDNADRVLF